MTTPPDLPALLRARLRDVLDFPEPGVVFKDIGPLLADRETFAGAVDALAERAGAGALGGRVDQVAGIEARGFILGAAVAYRLGAGFLPLRKQGKLPGAVHAVAYDLEYGQAVLEVHTDGLRSGARVLVVDDVLATGGTAVAAARLVLAAGGEVAGVAVLLELGALGGRERIGAELPGLDVHALLST